MKDTETSSLSCWKISKIFKETRTVFEAHRNICQKLEETLYYPEDEDRSIPLDFRWTRNEPGFFPSDSGLTVRSLGLLETGIGSFSGVDNRENEQQDAHWKKERTDDCQVQGSSTFVVGRPKRKGNIVCRNS